MTNQLKAIPLYGTTDGSGDLTVLAEFSIPAGWLVAVEWIDGGFADGVDAVLSVVNRPYNMADKTLLTLTDANSDDTYYPRELEHDVSSAELATYSLMPIEGTLKLVVSSGGDTKTGGCVVYYTDPNH